MGIFTGCNPLHAHKGARATVRTLIIPDDLETYQQLLRELWKAHRRLQQVHAELLATCTSMQDSSRAAATRESDAGRDDQVAEAKSSPSGPRRIGGNCGTTTPYAGMGSKFSPANHFHPPCDSAIIHISGGGLVGGWAARP